MGFVDLKMSKKEVKESQPTIAKDDGRRYPWGTSMTFEKETIDKLGLDTGKLEVGQEIRFGCVAKVTGISTNEYDGGDSRTVSLQITKIDLEDTAKGKFAKYKDQQGKGPGE